MLFRTSFRVGLTLSIACLLLSSIFVSLLYANEIDPDSVVSGDVPRTADLIGFRLRAFGKPSEKEVYIGVPNLGGGGHRLDSHLTWATGENEFVFTVDKTADAAEIVIINATGHYTTTYPDITTQLVKKGYTYTVDYLDTLAFSVVQRDSNGVVDLYDLHLNQIPLGNYGIDEDGWSNWTLSEINLSGDIVLTGTVFLSGTFGNSAELSKFQVDFGVTSGCAAVSAPDVDIAASDPDVVLGWNNTQNYPVSVWHFDLPYQQTGQNRAVNLVASLSGSTDQYVDVNGLDVEGGRFYQLEFTNACGFAESKELAKFTYGLTPGS